MHHLSFSVDGGEHPEREGEEAQRPYHGLAAEERGELEQPPERARASREQETAAPGHSHASFFLAASYGAMAAPLSSS